LRESSTVGRGAFALFSSNLIFSLMSFGFYLLVVHLMSANSLGIFYTLQLVWSLTTTFAFLSLPSGFLRFVTGYVQTDRVAEARYLFRRSIVIALVIILIVVPLLFLFAPILSTWLFGSEQDLFLIYLTIVDFALYGLGTFLSVSLYATRAFNRVGQLQIVYGVLRFGLAVLLFFAGFGVPSLIYGWIVADAFYLVFYSYLSKLFWNGLELKNELKKVITFSLPFFISSGIVLVLQNVDRLFVLKYLGLDELGIYGTLLIAAGVPQLLPSSLGTALLPAVIKIEEKDGLVSDVVTKSIRYITILTLPTLSLLAGVSKPLISVILGSSFAFAWIAFAVLTVGYAAMSPDIPLGQVLTAKKKTRVLAIQQVVSGIVLAGLALVLIPEFFLTGAALAYVLARLAGFVFILPSLYRLKLFKVEWLEYAKIVASSSLILLVTVAVESLTAYKLAFLPLYLLVGAGAGVASVKLLRVFREEDYHVMMDFMPKRFRDVASVIWRILGLPIQRDALESHPGSSS